MSVSRNGKTRGRKTAGRPLVWPGDPKVVTAEDVDIEALAHVLANTCRFGGRTRRFYSIAQHAVVASEEIEALEGLRPEERRQLALHALLADARIAWLGEVQAGEPGSARAAERSRRDGATVDRAVREAASLNDELTAEGADLLRFVARMTDAAERRDLADAGFGFDPGLGFPPLRRRIRPVEPGRAARLWLARYRALASPTGGADAAGRQPNAIDEEETGDVTHLPNARASATAQGTDRDDEGQPLAA